MSEGGAVPLSVSDAAPLRIEAVVRREHFAELSTVAGKQLARGGSMLPIGVGYWIAVGIVALALFRFADANLVAIDADSFGPSEVVLIALLSGAITTLLLQWLMARRIAARHRNLSLREGGSYLGPRTFTLDADGLRIEGAHGMTLTRWPVIVEVSETAQTLLLWTDPGAAIMVPKDAFASDADRAAFVALVEARIGGAGAV